MSVPDYPNRRKFLSTVSGLSVVAIAGCSGTSSSSGNTESSTYTDFLYTPPSENEYNYLFDFENVQEIRKNKDNFNQQTYEEYKRGLTSSGETFGIDPGELNIIYDFYDGTNGDTSGQNILLKGDFDKSAVVEEMSDPSGSYKEVEFFDTLEGETSRFSIGVSQGTVIIAEKRSVAERLIDRMEEDVGKYTETNNTADILVSGLGQGHSVRGIIYGSGGRLNGLQYEAAWLDGIENIRAWGNKTQINDEQSSTRWVIVFKSESDAKPEKIEENISGSITEDVNGVFDGYYDISFEKEGRAVHVEGNIDTTDLKPRT